MAIPDLAQTVAALPQMSVPQQGMFGGGKLGVMQAIVAALNGYLAGRGNPVGMQNMQMMQQMQQYKRDRADKQADRGQEIQDALALYDAKRKFDIANPLPQQPSAAGSMDALRAEYLDPNTSPERKAQLEPIVMQPQLQMVPGLGLVSVPRSGAQSAPTAPVGKLTPLGAGGPMPQASGGFRY